MLCQHWEGEERLAVTHFLITIFFIMNYNFFCSCLGQLNRLFIARWCNTWSDSSVDTIDIAFWENNLLISKRNIIVICYQTKNPVKSQANPILQKTKMELTPYATNNEDESEGNKRKIKHKHQLNCKEWNSPPVIIKIMELFV